MSESLNAALTTITETDSLGFITGILLESFAGTVTETSSIITTFSKTLEVPLDLSTGLTTLTYDQFSIISPSTYVSATSVSDAVYYYSISVPSLTTSISQFEVVWSVDSTTSEVLEIVSLHTVAASTSGIAAISAFSTSRSSSTSSTSLSSLVSQPTSPTSGSAATSTSGLSPEASHPSHAGAIAGGVVGGLAGLALIAGAVVFYLRRQKKRARHVSVQEVSQI